MRKLLQKILTGPIIQIANRYSSRPDRDTVFSSLDLLYRSIRSEKPAKGMVLPHIPGHTKFIVFSDHHKGGGNGADDFMVCEPAYTAALAYYLEQQYHYIGLGDCEELWENTLTQVKAAYPACFELEKRFAAKGGFTKIFGNHDLFWDQDPFASLQLKNLYEQEIKIYEGAVIETVIGEQNLRILLTHGHQGDRQSDGNWFSKFFVARVWGPLQAYLRINPNTPAYNSQLKTWHNTLMYEWSARQRNLLLVTGHTHQPVFRSLTLLENLVRQLDTARALGDEDKIRSLGEEIRKRKVELPVAGNLYDKILPTYFNSGCCCYSDGDITGIEIEETFIRLVKWELTDGRPVRTILEEQQLAQLMTPAISV
ncbi:metallophosphoesterase [Sediminibacterium sp. WSJ-3]|nr:metallophosphoesterase [Sediminibacterium soli]